MVQIYKIKLDNLAGWIKLW